MTDGQLDKLQADLLALYNKLEGIRYELIGVRLLFYFSLAQVVLQALILWRLYHP
jgi:hypothetical protein